MERLLTSSPVIVESSTTYEETQDPFQLMTSKSLTGLDLINDSEKLRARKVLLTPL